MFNCNVFGRELIRERVNEIFPFLPLNEVCFKRKSCIHVAL